MTILLAEPVQAATGAELDEPEAADCCGAMVTEDNSHRCPFCSKLRCDDCQADGWCCDDAAHDHIESERGEPDYWL